MCVVGFHILALNWERDSPRQRWTPFIWNKP
jgi:hypothetical protein